MGRDLTKCHPHLQKLAKELVIVCEKQGCPIGIGECFRTVQEQNRLYDQGRTKPGPVVTNAPGSTYRSMHQWGVAFDVYRKDGKGAYNESGNYFQRVGAIGKSLGLEWGGDWKSIVDKLHFSYRTGEVPRKDCEKNMEIPMLFRQPGRNRIHRPEKPHLPERRIAYRSEGTDSGQYTERMDPGTANRTDPAGISAGSR